MPVFACSPSCEQMYPAIREDHGTGKSNEVGNPMTSGLHTSLDLTYSPRVHGLQGTWIKNRPSPSQ